MATGNLSIWKEEDGPLAEPAYSDPEGKLNDHSDMIDDFLVGAGMPISGPVLPSFDALKRVINPEGPGGACRRFRAECEAPTSSLWSPGRNSAASSAPGPRRGRPQWPPVAQLKPLFECDLSLTMRGDFRTVVTSPWRGLLVTRPTTPCPAGPVRP